MKYKIIGSVEVTRSGRKRTLIKWLLYAAILVFSYSLMRSGVFRGWQPVFLIPLPIAVAMREQELPSCVFSLLCGLYTDCAYGFVFGFSAFWLIICGLLASLLSRNLVQPNLFNFLWLTAGALLLEFSMDYLFRAVLWDLPSRGVLLTDSILPTAGATLLLSPLVYFPVKGIGRRFGTLGGSQRYEPNEEEAEDSTE